jgi:hypothetical protein
MWDRWFDIAYTLKDMEEILLTKTTHITSIPVQMIIQNIIKSDTTI